MRVYNVIRVLTQHELSEDPHDLVATYLLNSTQHVSGGTQVFGATYVVWPGVVKVALVTALLLNGPWAYPAAIVAFLVFVVYQLYRYSHTHSPELLVLSVVDCGRHRAHLAGVQAATHGACLSRDVEATCRVTSASSCRASHVGKP